MSSPSPTSSAGPVKPFEVLDSPDKAKEEDEKKSVHPVVEAICRPEDDPDGVRAAMEANPGSLEVADDTGMTPLMHAAWKGKPRTTKMLIDMVRCKFLFNYSILLAGSKSAILASFYHGRSLSVILIIIFPPLGC